MSEGNVYQLIAAVASDMASEGIGKDRKNEQQGYKFRGIDDVYNALAPMMARHGLVILPRCVRRECIERTSAKGSPLFNVVVEAEFDFVSSHDSTSHTVRTFGEAMDSADKATNKAMSAAYKYAAFQTFCIPTEGDNDADSTTHEVKPRAVPTARPAAKSPTVEFPGIVADDAGGWTETIAKRTGQPADLVALLPEVDTEPNAFRRMAALRMLAAAIAENGTPTQIKAAGATVKAWPKERDGRTEIIGMFMAALKTLDAVTA